MVQYSRYVPTYNNVPKFVPISELDYGSYMTNQSLLRNPQMLDAEVGALDLQERRMPQSELRSGREVARNWYSRAGCGLILHKR